MHYLLKRFDVENQCCRSEESDNNNIERDKNNISVIISGLVTQIYPF